jgi:hypothetical protein
MKEEYNYMKADWVFDILINFQLWLQVFKSSSFKKIELSLFWYLSFIYEIWLKCSERWSDEERQKLWNKITLLNWQVVSTKSRLQTNWCRNWYPKQIILKMLNKMEMPISQHPLNLLILPLSRLADRMSPIRHSTCIILF